MRAQRRFGTYLSWWVAVLVSGCGTGTIQQSTGTGIGSEAGASGQPAERLCVSGVQEACDCPGSPPGVTRCNDSGTGFGVCECLETPQQSGDVADGGVPGETPQVPQDASVIPKEPPLAAHIVIREVALYQTVKVSLARDGTPVLEGNVPIIEGKPGLLRVFVEPQSGWVARDIEAVLTLRADAGPPTVHRATGRVGRASEEAELSSTFNFDLDGSELGGDVQYSVALHERTTAQVEAAADRARWPTEPASFAALGARQPGPLRLMVVPYRYLADGSGRLPAVDDANIERFRAFLAAHYPVEDIRIELHEPVDYPHEVGPDSGWTQWLQAHCELRARENSDSKVFYYGMLSPAADARRYGSGVAGIAYVPGPSANYGRCAVGLGFPRSERIMGHELGHALGLPHAPCGVGDAAAYPYDGGTIGVWGYELASGRLRDPETTYDLMGYCTPAFISDFNYQRLFDRIRYVNLQFARVGAVAATPPTYLRLGVDEAGVARWHEPLALSETPAGAEEARVVRWLAVDGAVLAEGTGYWLAASEAPAGLWLLPRPEVQAAQVQLEGLGNVRLP